MSVLHREISRGDIGADLPFPTGSGPVGGRHLGTGFHQIATSSPTATMRENIDAGKIDSRNPNDREVLADGDDDVGDAYDDAGQPHNFQVFL